MSSAWFARALKNLVWGKSLSALMEEIISNRNHHL
jgi:hypothetical protein